MALRARTGSARLETASLDERILEMEVENAAGSLRLRMRLRWVADEAEDDVADAELRSEAEEETLEVELLAREDVRGAEDVGEARSVEENLSAGGEGEGEGLV